MGQTGEGSVLSADSMLLRIDETGLFLGEELAGTPTLVVFSVFPIRCLFCFDVVCCLFTGVWHH